MTFRDPVVHRDGVSARQDLERGEVTDAEKDLTVPIDMEDVPDFINAGHECSEVSPGSGDDDDPMIELETVRAENKAIMVEMLSQGMGLQDSNTMATAMVQGALLEEILRALRGDLAVTQVLLRVEKEELSPLLRQAQKEMAKARLLQPGPQHDGRVTRPGRIT